MARRRVTTALARPTFNIPRAPAPIVRVSVPRPAKIKHRRRRHGGGRGHGLGGFGTTLGGAVVAAGLIGLAEKTGLVKKLPEVPIVGRKGAVAILAYLWARHGNGGQIARDIAISASVLAAYQLGKENEITGDGEAY